MLTSINSDLFVRAGVQTLYISIIQACPVLKKKYVNKKTPCQEPFPSRAAVLSNLNLHPAGKGKGHRSLPMHRDLLDQVSPVVCEEFGDAVRQGFDLGDEALNLLHLLFLLMEVPLGGGQRLFRILVPGKHLIVAPLVVFLILRHAGVLVDELLDKLRRQR